MNEAIRTCPFCGSVNVEIDNSDASACSWGQCQECGASGGPRETYERAVEAWNRRASLGTAPTGVSQAQIDHAMELAGKYADAFRTGNSTSMVLACDALRTYLASLSAPVLPVGQEPAAWIDRHQHPWSSSLGYVSDLRWIKDEVEGGGIPLYTHPAPASPVVLEAGQTSEPLRAASMRLALATLQNDRAHMRAWQGELGDSIHNVVMRENATAINSLEFHLAAGAQDSAEPSERERCAQLCEEMACMVDDGAGMAGRLWQVARIIRSGEPPLGIYKGRTEPANPREEGSPAVAAPAPTSGLSNQQVRALMRVAHEWAGVDATDGRSDNMEMALREVRVGISGAAAAEVRMLTEAEITEAYGHTPEDRYSHRLIHKCAEVWGFTIPAAGGGEKG